MSPDIAKGNLGNVGNYDVALTGGKLQISLTAADGAVSGTLALAIDAKIVVDAIFAKIPGGVITQEIAAAIDTALAAT